jgi:ABC transporter with metal-binding/Fe-S-binding domain ATP-binding protein
MKLGILFSGGKDSCYASYLAKQEGHEICCLISIVSENRDSYMFHTPFIEKVFLQAKEMRIPLIIVKTRGEKEHELVDLETAIKQAIKRYEIEGVVTGAIESVYQASRVQKICNKLKLECFNPLWQKNAEEHWKDLLKNKFKVILVSVAADGLDKNWVGKEIDNKNLEELIQLSKKYRFHLAFEGGEAETFVVNCPLFKNSLEGIFKPQKFSEEFLMFKKEVKV